MGLVKEQPLQTLELFCRRPALLPYGGRGVLGDSWSGTCGHRKWEALERLESERLSQPWFSPSDQPLPSLEHRGSHS